MLLTQIANVKLCIEPRFGHKGKFVAVTLPALSDGRQLKKVPRHHDLDTTKGRVVFAQMLEHLIDRIELLGMQHRYFINNQYSGFFYALNEGLFACQNAQVFFAQAVFDANPRPAVNGRAVHVRGSNARTGSDGNGHTARAQIVNVLVERIGLARPCRPCQKHVLTRFQNI